MASTPMGLSELITINNENLSGGVVNELLQDAPLVRAMAAIQASNGTNHSFLRYDSPPTVGFRGVNDGRDFDASSDTTVDITCKILDASFSMDVQVARGYRGGPEALLQREASRHMRSAFQTLEQQLIYGTNLNANGFAGIYQHVGALSNEMVFDGGGTENLSSVLLIRSTDPLTTAAIVTGNDGNITMDPAVLQRVAGSTGFYGAYFQNISSWYAYQHASKYSVARIANIDSTGNVVDDDLIAEALAAFPADRQPNMVVMNRPLQRQLRQSRTATNPTGQPAPFPTEVFGLPVIITDQLSTNEDVVS